MQTKIALNPGETVELTLLLGEENSAAAAVGLIERYRSLDLDAALKGVEAILHFAAKIEVGESVVNPRIYFENNVAGALNLMSDACFRGKAMESIRKSLSASVKIGIRGMIAQLL